VKNASLLEVFVFRALLHLYKPRTRANTNPNGTEANAAGRSVRACVARESRGILDGPREVYHYRNTGSRGSAPPLMGAPDAQN
jgi:hypothetical protein